jgi:hypothetical protein
MACPVPVYAGEDLIGQGSSPPGRPPALQSFGRFTALALEWPAPTAAERFHKRLVLADCCRFFGDRKDSSRAIEMPGMSLDREELDRVVERARAWLEEEAREDGKPASPDALRLLSSTGAGGR